MRPGHLWHAHPFWHSPSRFYPEERHMTTREKVFPWIIAGLGLVYLVWILVPAHTPGPDEFNFADFGVLPVMESGRIKPIDTVARSNLTVITHKQTFKDEADHSQP